MIHVGSGETIMDPVHNSVRLTAVVKGKARSIFLKGVLHAPELLCNLICFSRAEHSDLKVIRDNDYSDLTADVLKLEHKSSVEVKMVGIEREDGLYEAVVTNSSRKAHVTTKQQHVDWYSQTGYFSKVLLKATIPHVLRISIAALKRTTGTRDGSVHGKSVRVSWKCKQSAGAMRPVDSVHTDVAGPMNVLSLGNKLFRNND